MRPTREPAGAAAAPVCATRLAEGVAATGRGSAWPSPTGPAGDGGVAAAVTEVGAAPAGAPSAAATVGDDGAGGAGGAGGAVGTMVVVAAAIIAAKRAAGSWVAVGAGPASAVGAAESFAPAERAAGPLAEVVAVDVPATCEASDANSSAVWGEASPSRPVVAPASPPVAVGVADAAGMVMGMALTSCLR